ncbi:MAG: RNA methyltransferase [Anaerolineae bacterium]|nr:RNA methyltransferase [Anaerolineae bacterium]
MKRITSVNNPQIRRVHALQHSTRQRLKEKRMVVEGYRLVRELLAASLPVETLFATADAAASSQYADILSNPGCDVVEVSESAFKSMADTETPQGILALCPIPEIPVRTEKPALYLVVDQVRDPGNLGTILRTAWAAGVHAVYTCPGTIDHTNPKVVRAGMGAHFNVPIYKMTWESVSEKTRFTHRWAADAVSGQPYDEVDWTEDVTLIIGGEAEGFSSYMGQISNPIHIPMASNIESLNAAMACAIILFEAVKQRRLG